MAKEIEKKETHETKNIYEKLMIFQGKGISFEKSANVDIKTKSGQRIKYSYMTLDSINKKIKPILTEVGLVINHSLCEGKLTTRLTNVNDVLQYIESVVPVGSYSDLRSLGSAITYLKRYNTVALLNLDAETDDDAEEAVKEPTKKPFDKEAQDAFKNAIIGDKYPLPSTIDLLYKDLEKRYMLTQENKDMLVPLYEVIEVIEETL